MAYIFKSRATGNLLMLDKSAKQILEIIGKDSTLPGIITVEQIPQAITSLEQAIHASKIRAAAKKEAQEKNEEREDEEGDSYDQDEKERFSISLEQRAWPFIEMLKTCYVAQKDVVWGV